MTTKTIKEIGVGGKALTKEGHTVEITAIEPCPILQVCYGKSVTVRYRDEAGNDGEMVCGDETEVNVPV
jgi:hypothetical protein